MREPAILLYPSSWLYNAGVVGLLSVQEKAGEHLELQEDGSYRLQERYFEPVQIESRKIPRAICNLVNYLVPDEELKAWLDDGNREKYRDFGEALGEFGFRFVRAGNKLFSSHAPYQNLVSFREWQSFEFSELVEKIPNLIRDEQSGSHTCNFCGAHRVSILNPQSKLQQRLTKLQSCHLQELGPSAGKFQNSFWSLNQSMKMCFLCAFLILHHHLAFTPLSDGSEIFINAPSFKLMHYLNRFGKKAFSSASLKEAREKGEILAMSVVEYATKVKATLGIWTSMNIEIVSRRKPEIEFFSLPYELFQLLSDRKIAHVLSEIGEFFILRILLNQNFSQLIEVGYHLLQAGLKPEGGEERFKNELRLERNRKNPARVAEQIFQLFAFIEEKRHRREMHEQSWFV